MAELLTAKDLAEKAGITPAELRKLLRVEFNRAGKTQVEGKRMEYRFATSDPMVKEIMDKARIIVKEKSAPVTPQPEKAEKEGDC